jgi:hypothetical protein
MFETNKAPMDPKSVELNDNQLDKISGGAMSDAEFMQFFVTVSNWAKEQGSKPVRLPGL